MSKFGEGDLQHRPVRPALRPTVPACPLRCHPSPPAPTQGQRIGLGLYPQETPGNAQRFFWLSQLGCRCWYSRGKIMVRGQGPASIYCIGAHCKELSGLNVHEAGYTQFASVSICFLMGTSLPNPTERKAFPPSPHYRGRLSEVILCYHTEGDTPSSYRVPGSSVWPQSLCLPSYSNPLTMD